MPATNRRGCPELLATASLSRRSFVKAGILGTAGLSLADILRSEARASAPGATPRTRQNNVIILWMRGGPSHIDMWDPKPDAPREIRSPFATISTRVPGVQFTEHLPLQASIADKLSVLRAVDCSASNHTPITMQAGNPLVALSDARTLHKAMLSENLELSVNMDHWMTPCGELADYVLPATDGLERPLLSNMWGFGNAHSASRRTVDPLYERRDDYQLWRELGNRLGQQGMWPDTMEEWFSNILAPTGLSHGELSDRDMPWIFGTPSHKRFEERGGFATASGKVELGGDLLKSLGYPGVPEYEEPAWSPVRTPELFERYPLIMSTGNSLKWYYRSQHKHLAKMRKQHPYALLTIHPETAAGLGIGEGEMVWVETPIGRVQQQAKFDPNMHPRVVHADSHMWYPEREAQGDAHYGVWESNINAILPDGEEFTDYAGDNYMRGLICKVTRVAA